MPVSIEQVNTRRSLREFIFLPRELYRDNPFWSPPIWLEERATFSKSNPILARSEYAMFLARSGGRTAGRILAYVDHNFNDFYRSKTGMLGAFECVENREVAAALLEGSERWLRSRGMEVVRGPINPVSECWGLLYDGFDSPPMFMTPYNPAYYNRYFEQRGYAKVKDLLAYEGDARRGYQIPQRFLRFTRKLASRRPNIKVRRIHMNRLAAEAEAIWSISNRSISGNWGWVPYEREELEAVFRKLKPIADPDAIWMVEDSGVAVGFCLGFPDLNILLRRIKGRLFPLGFITLLRGARRLKDFRLFGLAVLPEYQGLGLDVLLYTSLYETLAPRGVHLEANYILEDNPSMLNALEKLGLKRTKIYRIYEKRLSGTILFDGLQARPAPLRESHIDRSAGSGLNLARKISIPGGVGPT